MKNIFALSSIRWIQRFSMVLTLGCFAYVIFFLFFKSKDNPIAINSIVLPSKHISLLSSPPVFDLRPLDSNESARDIFSLNSDVSTATGAVENTPKGQLP